MGATKHDAAGCAAIESRTPTYFWRVDEAQADGRVVTGRVARFGTSGLVAWWKLDETKGTKAEDATGHQFTGKVVGKANWAPEQGRIGGAMEFDGKNDVHQLRQGAGVRLPRRR